MEHLRVCTLICIIKGHCYFCMLASMVVHFIQVSRILHGMLSLKITSKGIHKNIVSFAAHQNSVLVWNKPKSLTKLT